ncbi:hypothetical protein MMC27_008596 [Xylographa pallens]|nr:hypothetical protein [Xylographa pallens]
MSWHQMYPGPQPDVNQDFSEWDFFNEQQLMTAPAPGTDLQDRQTLSFPDHVQTNSSDDPIVSSPMASLMYPSQSNPTMSLYQAFQTPARPVENFDGSSYSSSDPSAQYAASRHSETHQIPLGPPLRPADSSKEVNANTASDNLGCRRSQANGTRSLHPKTSNLRRKSSAPCQRKQPSNRIEKRKLPKTQNGKSPDISSRNARWLHPKEALSKQDVFSDAKKVCDIWMKRNPNKSPEELDFYLLESLFNVPVNVLRERLKTTLEDSGYQTTLIPEPDITVLYQRKRCKRPKVSATGSEAPMSTSKDPYKTFACSHRCGARFAKKGPWEKHEQTHYRQKLWACCEQECRDRQKPWFRKDRFKNHLIKYHKYKVVRNEDFKASYKPITSRFPKICNFRNCVTRFNDWKDRIDHIAEHFKGDYDMSMWKDLVDEEREGEDDCDITESADEVSDSENGQNSSSDDDRKDEPDNYYDRHNNDEDSDSSSDDQGGAYNKGSYESGGSFNQSEPKGHSPSERHSGLGAQNGRVSDVGGSSLSETQAHEYSNFQIVLQTELSSRTNPHSRIREAYSQPFWNSVLTWDTRQLARSTIWVLGNLNLVFVRWLGSGATASVDEVRHQGSKETMARKTVHYSLVAERHKANQEAYIMHRLRHPHVVRLLTTYSDLSTSTILMKPAADYSLSQYLQTRSLTEPIADEAFGWFSCLVSGLKHIHEQNVLHGDIKPHNILIFEGRLLYADFGLSATIPHHDAIISDAGFVTKRYAAPEVKEGVRGKASDIWSLGCVFLEMLIVMLNHSIKDLLNAQNLLGISIEREACYSDNPAAVAASIRSCRSITKYISAPASILEALDCCETMLISNLNERPTVHDLAKRIKPRFCCTPRLSELPHQNSWINMESRQDSMRQDCVMNDVVQQTLKSSHAYRADVRMATKQRVKSNQDNDPGVSYCVSESSAKFDVLETQSSMLFRWLREPIFSYEAFCITESPLTNPYEHLISESKAVEPLIELIEQLSVSSETITPVKNIGDGPSDGCEAGYESTMSLTMHDLFGEYCHGTSTDRMSLDSVASIRPAYSELRVYSKVKKTWSAVQALLDSGTRLNWVSRKLIDELEVQDESGSGIDTNMSIRSRKVGQQHTVQLQWRWPNLNYILDNWFLVVEQPIDIVIGSDILFSLATYKLHYKDCCEASITETRHRPCESTGSSQKGSLLDVTDTTSLDPKQLFPRSKHLRTMNTSVAKPDDFGSPIAFAGGAVYIIHGGTENRYTEDYTLTDYYSLMRVWYIGFLPARILDCRTVKWVTNDDFQFAAFKSSLIDGSLGE